MSINKHKTDPKFVRAYDRGMLRSAFVSLFWSVITERRKKGPFTLQQLAKILGANKAEVSRWFKGQPNWTIGTIANIANALDLDIKIQAVDRKSGEVFTPAGPVQSYIQSKSQPITTSSGLILAKSVSTRGPEPEKKVTGFSDAA
jgi:transcriptional regulator with XRE-family HTH domain